MEEEKKKKKLNFVSNGVVNLPPGFRFEPTDEEIVFEYLKFKVFGLPLPAAVIPDINVYDYDPWNLPGEIEKDKYFFCNKKMNLMSSSKASSTCSGYWKSTGEERLILSSSTSADNRLIGLRMTMSFHKVENISSFENKEIITDWKMHEYYMIILSRFSSADRKSHRSVKKSSSSIAPGGWSICHILKKRDKSVIFSSTSTTRNKRMREDVDIEIEIESNDDKDKIDKLSKLDNNGGRRTCSESSCGNCSCKSSSSSSSIKDDDTGDINSSCLHYSGN